MTDEEVEMADKQTVVTPKKSLEEQMKESLKNEDNIIKEELVKETEEELKKDIPSSFIEINLVSNGRIEGIPSKLHFRCYSASDALDLNVDDDNKVKAITKVLTRLNYENFDVSKLPIQDVLHILYTLHACFISSKISKKVYIDDTIEDEKLLNADENLEEVDIPITSIAYAYLGKDYDDNELEGKIKVPFTIKNNATNESVSFKFTVLKDMLRAETYCKNYFKDEFIRYADIRSALNKIHAIRDEEKQDKVLDDFLNENEEKVSEYYEFMVEYAKMVAKIIQAQTLVMYNGKKLESLDEQWDVYSNKLSYDVWQKYNDVVDKYPFGIRDDLDVYIPSLRKKVHRRVGFQFDDFIHTDRHENSDRCTVEFD
jgi:hypothetical protein